MNMSEMIIVLSGGLVGVVVGTILTSLSTHLLKAHEYKREYYKTIINERLEYLKYLTHIVTCLRAVEIDDHHGPYHHVLRKEGRAHDDFLRSLSMGSLNMMWFSEHTCKAVDELFHLVGKVFHDADADDRGIASAAENYSQISNAREKLHEAIVEELWNMHKVPNFLKGKKKPPSTGKSHRYFDVKEWKWVK